MTPRHPLLHLAHFLAPEALGGFVSGIGRDITEDRSALNPLNPCGYVQHAEGSRQGMMACSIQEQLAHARAACHKTFSIC